jgi:hypothetical protein
VTRKMPPLEELLGHAEPDRAALDRVWGGLKRRERRRALRPFVLAGTLLAAAVAVAVWLVFTPAQPSGQGDPFGAALAAATPPTTLTTADGSTLTLDRGAQAHAAPSAAGVVLHVDRGTVHLSVRDGAAAWTVETARLKVVVLASTSLELDVSELGDTVSVTRGQATVSGREVVTPVVLGGGQRFSTATRSWLDHARSGSFEAAWRLLGAEGVRREAALASPGDALLLADIAATGKDEPLAIEVLEGVTRAAASPQRELAWFSLGLRLSAAGETRNAARAFEASYTPSLPKELRRDACTRAAEAWQALGDATQATLWRERATLE